MSRPATPGAGELPESLEDFMAQALQMELDAAQRYSEFADMMETHNNVEVGQWFRKMAVIEGKHAAQIIAQMGWAQAPLRVPRSPVFEGFEAPESAAVDDVHYLMQPWHVLQLALANEERAERFYGQLASLASVESVRQAALELQREEAQHVELVKAWMLKVAQPDSNWDLDPDPPRYDD
jgi:rubrerythrin